MNNIVPVIIGAVVSGFIAAIASSLTVLIAASRRFGSLESEVKGIKDDVRDIRDEKDVVRWSQLGAMGAINFPPPRSGVTQ